MKKLLKQILKYLNIRLVRGHSEDKTFHEQQLLRSLSIIKEECTKNSEQHLDKLKASFISFILSNYTMSNSQNFQDLLCIWALKEKKQGVFVEFGAVDGIHLSNTLLLEKKFDWRGLLAEPGKEYHDDLIKNRNCHIEHNCIWKKSGENIEFTFVPGTGISNTLNKSSGLNHIKYNVNTISLNDALDKYNIDKIDFLSIDTEGTEYEILSHLEFNNIDISLICVEHNYKSRTRENIYNLLTKNGFNRLFSELSFQDDWYIKHDLL